MILPDVNVLLYAFRSDAENHAAYRTWLEGVVNGDTAYGMSPQVLASVIRLATHPRIFARPDPAGGRASLRIGAPGSATLPDHSARASPLGYFHAAYARARTLMEIWCKTPGWRPWPSNRAANGSPTIAIMRDSKDLQWRTPL